MHDRPDFATPIEPGARPRQPGDELVFRTGVLLEADMVAAALEEAGIPYYRRTMMLDGQELPGIAGRGGLGQTLLILVPAAAAEQARDLVEGLPLDEPGDEGGRTSEPRPRVRRLYRLVAAIFVGLFALWLIYAVSLLIGGLLS